MATLASVTDLIYRFDVRTLGQLASDDNTQIASGALLTSEPVLAALEDATGLINSALYTAYKYNATDIAGLSDESSGLLKRLCSDIAFVYLAQRRGYTYKEKFPLLEDSYEILQKLRNGERILDIDDNKDAGNTATVIVTASDNIAAGLATQKKRYFPT